jgi:hypothetical protein
MKTMTKPVARRRPSAKAPPVISQAQAGAILDPVEWEFRFVPPTARSQKIRTRFVQGGSEPFVGRPDPRD